MSGGDPKALEEHYHRLQARWGVLDRTGEYGRLVVPSGNADEPLYRWFHLKEAFSMDLLEVLATRSDFSLPESLRVGDPFSGSGTSLISALSYAASRGDDAEVFGVERNPFIWELSQAKLQGRLLGSSLVATIREQISEVRKAYEGLASAALARPNLSTLHNGLYFPPLYVDSLVRIREAIDSVAEGPVKNILRICLASCVEPASRLRRDGRALRLAPERTPQDPYPLFLQRVEMAVADLAATKPSAGSGNVVLGDARDFSRLSTQKSYDLLLFSPPYPNNIDYTEIYKTEAWALGCYSDSSDMKSQRLKTIRSHPSIRFDQAYAYASSAHSGAVESLLAPILESVPKNSRYLRGRQEVIQGYADDMLSVLAECRRVIDSRGKAVFVVGNSHHGSASDGYVIAADVIMARLAELVGWRVKEISVARILKRRQADSNFLRESIVILEPA